MPWAMAPSELIEHGAIDRGLVQAARDEIGAEGLGQVVPLDQGAHRIGLHRGLLLLGLCLLHVESSGGGCGCRRGFARQLDEVAGIGAQLVDAVSRRGAGCTHLCIEVCGDRDQAHLHRLPVRHAIDPVAAVSGIVHPLFAYFVAYAEVYK